MYKTKIEADLKNAVRELGFVATDVVCAISENSKFGDYTSNVALQLSKQDLKKRYQSPRDIASTILDQLGHPAYLERVEVAGPGFINFFLKDSALLKLLSETTPEIPDKVVMGDEKRSTAQRTLVEFAHPNTHKAFHIGHLRNVSVGESISRLLEFNGHIVFRVTYGGDIGPHVAKALWGVQQLKDEFESVKAEDLRQKAEFLGRAYARGSKSFEENPQAKQEIEEINKKLYGNDEQIKQLWHETKEWSIGYFETIYLRVGTEFEAEIWESEIQEEGVLIVEENLGKVFEKDQGAIIFPGEKYGLHNRVFITSKGYPTYEGKELGLTRKEQALFPYDRSLHVVANEQQSFFDVTTKALEMIEPAFKGKKKHLSYGMVNLSSGKMSSRKGEVITADSLIEDVKASIAESYAESAKTTDPSHLDKIAIGAIKFYYLKYSLPSDIAFDVEQSVSLQGDSGPYVMYTYARTRSLLNRAIDFKAKSPTSQAQATEIAQSLEPEEREVLRILEYFPAITKEAVKKFAPNELCNYLLNLAKHFNLFYEKHPIIESKNSTFRLKLTERVGDTIKVGLYLLGIETVERM